MGRHSSDEDRDKRRRDKDKEKKKDKGRKRERAEEEDLWVEKALAAPAAPAAQRDDWMSFAAEPTNNDEAAKDSVDTRDSGNDGDLFDSMFSRSTRERKSKSQLLEDKRAEEEKKREMGRSTMEMNPFWKEGGDGLPPEMTKKRKFEFGDAGSAWRMLKLRKTKEIAEEEGRRVEDVAMERYGSLGDYDEALEERRYLDNRKGRGDRSGGGSRSSGNGNRSGGSRMDDREYSGRQHLAFKGDSFRRPNEERYNSPSAYSERSAGTGTPGPSEGRGTPQLGTGGRSTPQPPAGCSTPQPSSAAARFPPIPSVIPQASTGSGSTPSKPILTTDQLNKLQAKILKARLMKDPKLADLEREYETEKARASAPQSQPKESVVVLPTLDSRGRLHDHTPSTSAGPPSSKRSKPWAEARTQGDMEADPERAPDLMELLRREKMGEDEDFDRDFAERIAKDGKFRADLDYLDEQSDRMARKIVRSDDKLKQHAVSDYKKVSSALEKCAYCYQDDGKTAPKVAMVSLGNKTYLGLTEKMEMVKGHCVIVPIQHVNNSLEMDDDAWEEVRVGYFGFSFTPGSS